METLNIALIEIINAAVSAKDFILAQTPDVIQQLLTWKMAYSLLWFSFWIALTLVCLVVYYKLNKWIYEPVKLVTDDVKERIKQLTNKGYSGRTIYEDRELAQLGGDKTRISEYGGTQWIPLTASIVPLAVAISECMDWLQILIAPKVYLIEYAVTLVK